MARVWILPALVLVLLASACGNGDDGSPATPTAHDEATGPASGIAYVRTPTHLVHFDLGRRTAELRDLPNPQFLLFETAVVAGNDLALADVSRSEGSLFGGEDEWIVTLRVINGATGRERDQVILDPLPLRDVPSLPPDSQDCFCSVGSIRVWYVPQTHTLLVGTVGWQAEATSYRLDIVDSEEWIQRRSIDLGTLPGGFGDIHVATDTAANVAVLLTGSPHSRLIVGPPDLSSFEAVDEPIADCSIVEAASTHRSQRPYFLCLRPPQDTAEFPASMLVVEDAKNVRQYPLPPRFEQNLQAGTVDSGDRVFIGIANPVAPTVLTFDLATGGIVAQREFELASNSSWGERLKRFFLGQPAYAITVVFKPIAASPDGTRIFFADGFRTLWCIRADDLSVAGKVEIQDTQVLAMTTAGRHVLAAGDRGIEGGSGIRIVNGAQCRLVGSLGYDSARGQPLQILVP